MMSNFSKEFVYIAVENDIYVNMILLINMDEIDMEEYHFFHLNITFLSHKLQL